jgi:hypothetical protein
VRTLYRVIQNDCRGFNNLSYTIYLVLQMQAHVISYYGVTSRIRFMIHLFPQLSRNWRLLHVTNSLERTRLSCWRVKNHKRCTYRAPIKYVTKTWSVVLLNKEKIHILLYQVYCVWQVVKTPTILSNNPVLYLIVQGKELFLREVCNKCISFYCSSCSLQNTGLFKSTLGVLTTSHTKYTWDRSICFFYLIEEHPKFLLHTL